MRATHKSLTFPGWQHFLPAHPQSAARKLAFLFHGPMAVMTSPAFDKSPVDLKASVFAPADTMAVDTEANG